MTGAPRGILVFGLNGSGKTTLARELARVLGFFHMDHEHYYFEKSDVPYTAPRPPGECLALMRADIEARGAFVLSAVTGDFGDEIERHYALAVLLSAPLELRLTRIRQREYSRHGARICAGGDMYIQHREFMAFVAARPPGRVERYAETLACPLVRIDGARDARENAAAVARLMPK